MITTTFNFTDASGFDFTDTEISGGAAKQTAPFQLEANLIMSEPKKVRLFSAFSAAINLATPSHEVTFIVEDDGTLKYWNGAAWATSDGSAAQSNTAAEMSANLPSLITDLTTHDIRFEAVFQSPDTLQTSELEAFSFSYVSGFNTCTVYVALVDLENVTPTIDPANPPKLYVSNDRGFLQGCNAVYPFSQSVEFDALGVATIDVMETETTGEKLEFVITFPDGDSIESFRFRPSVVPDLAFANLSDIVGVGTPVPGLEIRAGSVPLPAGIKTRVITYLSDIGGTDYGTMANLSNLVDAGPIITPTIAITKPSSGLTAKWSAATDSANYSMDYMSILNESGTIVVQSGSVALAAGLYQSTVPFSLLNTDYAVVVMLTNITDGSVTIMPVTVINKSADSFTALWSSATSSGNYSIDYVIRPSCASTIFQGRRWASGAEAVAAGVKEHTTTFMTGIGTSYAAFGTMSNIVDPTPQIQQLLPVTKGTTSCKFIWSAATDSANYALNYIAVEIF
jgi:hypothetical protein